ncbi:MAG: CocE/NonD family hydrolase [Rhodobacteraceae bacterium]|nr:CocE/NonD family hydrolase [Paracoccaceae bacterium]
MTHLPNALREITETPDMGIVLSDGLRLSARVWMPADATDDPVPAILEYLPYRKRDGTCARDALTHPWFARRGYACVRVDIRGNGDSEGLMEDEYTARELADGAEVVAWLARQPWCSGTVGMMGISWGGFNGLQVAALAPPALKAVITLCSTVDRFADDIHYKGGCLLNENLGWGATMWSYSSRAPDPALRPDDWRAMWHERLEAEPFLPSVWLRHQRRDAYWRHGSVCEDYTAIRAKVLAVGGWGDAYKNAVPALAAALPDAKGIIGPWVHKYPHFAVPEPRIGFLQEALRWWDRWLKGADTGVESDPDMRIYLMDGVRPATWYTERAGRWITDESSAPAPVHEWPLAPGRLGGSAAPLETRIASPQDCGAAAGEYCAIWLGPEMPGDQRADDARSACFDSAPLAGPHDIVGAPRLRLRLRTDRAQAQIAVRLCHVHPDGASTRITYGVLNLSHRDGSADPQPMQPDTPTDIAVRLDHIAYRVPAGHRLRIAVSSAYWPLIWPAPDAASLTLLNGALELPLRDGADSTAGDEWTFAPPDADMPWAAEELRPEHHVRRSETDLTTGIVSLIVEDDFGMQRDRDHGLIAGSKARERWSIHPDDPLSARGACHWTDELTRADIKLRTETRCEMWADATRFHMTATLTAYENDVQVHHRQISDSVPRDHL